MNLNREIFSVLEGLAGTGEAVKLINTHKGIPVSYDAIIKGMTELGVVFQVQPFQMVCLELERQTFIYTEELSSIVKAKVAATDTIENQATLTGFAYTMDTIGKRLLARVEPAETVPVVISNNRRRLKAELLDISEVGIGLLTHPSYTYTPTLFTRGSQVRINLQLSADAAPIFIDGVIHHVVQSGEAHHLGIIISPSGETKESIHRFIAKRQAEILEELQMLYDQMYQMKVGQ